MKAPWLSFVMGAFLSLCSCFFPFLGAGRKGKKKRKKKAQKQIFEAGVSELEELVVIRLGDGGGVGLDGMGWGWVAACLLACLPVPPPPRV